MYVSLQFFQAFFVLNAKALLFVNDQQAKPLELNALGKERMCSHDDIDAAIS